MDSTMSTSTQPAWSYPVAPNSRASAISCLARRRWVWVYNVLDGYQAKGLHHPNEARHLPGQYGVDFATLFRPDDPGLSKKSI